MRRTLYKSLGISAVAVVLASFVYGGVYAAEKKKSEAGPPRCNSLTVEADCTARSDCSWVAASIDSKTQKQKRKAFCRSKPKAPSGKKADKKKT